MNIQKKVEVQKVTVGKKQKSRSAAALAGRQIGGVIRERGTGRIVQISARILG